MIPKQENASWRDQVLAKRRKPTLIPGPGSLSAPMEIIEEPVKVIEHGLQLSKRPKIDHPQRNDDVDMEAGNSNEAVRDEPIVEQKEETLDELAARRLTEGMKETATPSVICILGNIFRN